MRTHRHESAKAGEVIEVRSSISGRSYGTVIITDPRDTSEYHTVEGGHECREATEAEIKTAREEGRLRVSYD
jgi:hypothetical protein